MIVDGVNFNEEVIKGMTLETFIEKNITVFWQDRDEKVREKILTDVYYRIHPKPKKEEPVKAEE